MPLYDYEDEVFDGRGRKAKPASHSREGWFKRFLRLLWRITRILILVLVIIYVLPFVMEVIKSQLLENEPEWMKIYFEIMQKTQDFIASWMKTIGQ